MKPIDPQKKKDIIQFIDLSYLKLSHLDCMIPAMIKARLWNQPPGSVNVEDLIKKAYKEISNPEFSTEFVKLCDEIFTGEDLKELVKIYSSAIWKKYSTEGNAYTTLVVKELTRVCDDLTKEYAPCFDETLKSVLPK